MPKLDAFKLLISILDGTVPLLVENVRICSASFIVTGV